MFLNVVIIGFDKWKINRLKLDLLPELGGRINKLVFNEFHILRPFQIQNNKPLQSYKGGNFCLVPFSNRIKNSRFNFNQLEFKLAKNDPPNAIHGHAYLGKWNILKKTESSAVIAYKHFANKFGVYERKILKTVPMHSMHPSSLYLHKKFENWNFLFFSSFWVYFNV